MDNDFNGLDFLVNLNISRSSLSEIQPKAFFQTKNVEILDMSRNQLADVDLHQLRNLRKAQNKIFWLIIKYKS